MKLTVRQAQFPDWEAIKRFIDEAYGPLARFKGEPRWNWQFVDNPFQVKTDQLAPVWIAVDGSNVVGQIAVQAGLLQLNGIAYSAGWIVDVMILASHRGKGLGHRLYDAVTKSIPLHITLTMAPATRQMAMRAGCITLGPAREYAKLIHLTGESVRRYLLSRTQYRPMFHVLVSIACNIFRAHRLAAPAVNAWLQWQSKSALVRSRHDDTGIEEITSFGDEVDQFWDRVRHNYPAIFVRSSQFLNWRFFRAPDVRYRCFVARRSADCVGYMVLRRSTPEELSAGFIVDFLAAPGDSQTIEAFLFHAAVVFGGDIAAIDCVTSVPEIELILRRHGFRPVRTVHATVVCQDQILRKRINELKHSWYFTRGDHDWDQIHLA